MPFNAACSLAVVITLTPLILSIYYRGEMDRQSLTTRLLHGGASAAFRVGSRLTVEGRENIPPTGPVIVAVNHTHNMDPALIGVIMPWPVRFLAKRELVTQGNAASRWIVRNWGMIPITRDRLDREALRTARDYLQGGGAIGMFPEGTRSRDGRLGQARPGTGFLALTSGAPVLPVGIEGAVSVGHNPIVAARRPRLTARIGALLDFSELSASRADDRFERATDEIMRAIAGLLPEQMRGYYGDSARETQHGEERAER